MNWQSTSQGLDYVLDCKGPNKACKQAHKAGRPVHVIIGRVWCHEGSGKQWVSADRVNEDRGHLIMPSWHFATLEEGIAAISVAMNLAPTAADDEEWLRLEREASVPFRTRPHVNHPTRR